MDVRPLIFIPASDGDVVALTDELVIFDGSIGDNGGGGWDASNNSWLDAPNNCRNGRAGPHLLLKLVLQISLSLDTSFHLLETSGMTANDGTSSTSASICTANS